MTVQYPVAERYYQSLAPLADELSFLADNNYLFELPYLSIISAVGEQAQSFLQGQLTCDVKQVNAQSMRQGALCNLKGRVLALLDVLLWQEYQLVVPKDLLTETMSALATAAMLSRVKLHASSSYKFVGFYCNTNNHDLPIPHDTHSFISNENFCCYALREKFYMYCIKENFAEQFMQQYSHTLITKGSLAWHYLQLKQRHVSIYPQSCGLFLPHRLNLPELGYISFDKGCYKGQEIIARMHYRSKSKHHLQIFVISTALSLQPGMKLLDAQNGTEVAELIDFCPVAEKEYLIALSVLIDHRGDVKFEGSGETIVLHKFS